MRLFGRGERASTLDLLVVGLGNPGREHARDRHNAGWMVVDELARRHDGSFRSKFSGQLGEIRLDDLRLGAAQAGDLHEPLGRLARRRGALLQGAARRRSPSSTTTSISSRAGCRSGWAEGSEATTASGRSSRGSARPTSCGRASASAARGAATAGRSPTTCSRRSRPRTTPRRSSPARPTRSRRSRATASKRPSAASTDVRVHRARRACACRRRRPRADPHRLARPGLSGPAGLGSRRPARARDGADDTYSTPHGSPVEVAVLTRSEFERLDCPARAASGIATATSAASSCSTSSTARFGPGGRESTPERGRRSRTGRGGARRLRQLVLPLCPQPPERSPFRSAARRGRVGRPLLTALFALHRRVRPFNKFLGWELQLEPLGGERWTVEALFPRLQRIVGPGDLGEQQALFRDVELLARAARPQRRDRRLGA